MGEHQDNWGIEVPLENIPAPLLLFYIKSAGERPTAEQLLVYMDKAAGVGRDATSHFMWELLVEAAIYLDTAAEIFAEDLDRLMNNLPVTEESVIEILQTLISFIKAEFPPSLHRELRLIDAKLKGAWDQGSYIDWLILKGYLPEELLYQEFTDTSSVIRDEHAANIFIDEVVDNIMQGTADQLRALEEHLIPLLPDGDESHNLSQLEEMLLMIQAAVTERFQQLGEEEA